MTKALYRILVATPVGGGVVSHEYLHSIVALKDHCAALSWGMEFVTIPDGLVTRSRNAFASTVCRDEKFTHLLMLDADVTVSPQAIERLVRSDHDVAGCSVPLRSVDWDKVRGYLNEIPGASAESLRAVATQYAVWFERGHKARDGFLPVRAIGSAVMLISREALVRISESDLVQYASHGIPASDGHHDGWTFFDPIVSVDGIYLSEDYAFCDRWRALGGQVWADLESSAQHIGPVQIKGDIAMSISSANALTHQRRAQGSQTDHVQNQ